MSDATLPQKKYPDEVWWVPVEWAAALLDGETIVGTPTVTADGLVIDAISHTGTVTSVKVSGGSGYNASARLEFLATISTGEKLGFNLGVPIRPR